MADQRRVNASLYNLKSLQADFPAACPTLTYYDLRACVEVIETARVYAQECDPDITDLLAEPEYQFNAYQQQVDPSH